MNQTSSDWIELATAVDREAVEPVADLFSQYGHDHGVVIDEPFLQDRDGDHLRTDWTAPVRVRTYIPESMLTPELQHQIEQALWHIGQLRQVGELTLTPIRETDWANNWRDYFKPASPIEGIVVRPPWFETDLSAGELEVILDPGSAFGTGTHPTTILALRLLKSEFEPGDTVLDVGSGSGILAIAAAKLGAARVDAVEIDVPSVKQALANFELNQLEQISLETGGFDDDSRFADVRYDLTVANIIARILIELAPRLARSIKPDGSLVLSGIIDGKVDEVIATFLATGLELQSSDQIEDWNGQIWRWPAP